MDHNVRRYKGALKISVIIYNPLCGPTYRILPITEFLVANPPILPTSVASNFLRRHFNPLKPANKTMWNWKNLSSRAVEFSKMASKIRKKNCHGKLSVVANKQQNWWHGLFTKGGPGWVASSSISSGRLRIVRLWVSTIKYLLAIWMGDCLQTSKPSRHITKTTNVNSAFHPPGVSKSSTSLSD